MDRRHRPTRYPHPPPAHQRRARTLPNSNPAGPLDLSPPPSSPKSPLGSARAGPLVALSSPSTPSQPTSPSYRSRSVAPHARTTHLQSMLCNSTITSTCCIQRSTRQISTRSREGENYPLQYWYAYPDLPLRVSLVSSTVRYECTRGGARFPTVHHINSCSDHT